MGEAEGMENKILYALGVNVDDGVDLTVFQDGLSSTVELSQPLLKQLIEALNRYVQKDD